MDLFVLKKILNQVTGKIRNQIKLFCIRKSLFIKKMIQQTTLLKKGIVIYTLILQLEIFI